MNKPVVKRSDQCLPEQEQMPLGAVFVVVAAVVDAVVGDFLLQTSEVVMLL